MMWVAMNPPHRSILVVCWQPWILRFHSLLFDVDALVKFIGAKIYNVWPAVAHRHFGSVHHKVNIERCVLNWMDTIEA